LSIASIKTPFLIKNPYFIIINDIVSISIDYVKQKSFTNRKDFCFI